MYVIEFIDSEGATKYTWDNLVDMLRYYKGLLNNPTVHFVRWYVTSK